MKLHPTQSLVAKDKTRFRVVNCGRQWGKTTEAVEEMSGCAYAKGGRRIAYFATTHGQARDIAWEMFKKKLRPVLAKEPNETLLELTIKTQDGGTSEIFLKGWESIERSRGTQYDFIVCDEVSKMRRFKEGWEGVLLGTLAFRRGTALFISTPYGFNHFHDLYQLGQSGNNEWKSWRFTSFDNPYLPKDYLETIHNTVTEDFWAQEYLADFRRFTGLIYQEFDMNRHVALLDHEFGQHADYYFGQDFAVRGWTANLPCRITSDGKIYIPDNYKEQSLTAEQHSEGIKTMLQQYQSLDKWTGYADPAGFAKNQQKGDMLWSIADDYLQAGLPIVPANNEVTAGINFVRQLFKQDKIIISPKCTKLIDEIIQYQWKEQTATKVGKEDDPEKVRKINDHLVDAMRYMLYSKPTIPEELPAIPKSPLAIQFPPPRIEKEPEDSNEFTEIETISFIE